MNAWFSSRYIAAIAISIFSHAVFTSSLSDKPVSASPQSPQSAAAEASLEPQHLLSLMSLAMRERTYHGEFVYEHGSKLEAFHIWHHVVEGQEQERLYRLSNSEQTFERHAGQANCGTLGSHFLQGLSLSASGGEYFGLDRYYHMKNMGRDRVAGRIAHVVQLQPTDNYRFGLTLTIDAETHLLLSYVIYDPRKKIALERLQFVSFEVDTVSPKRQQSASIPVQPQQCVGAVYTPNGHSLWKPSWLPPGFILTSYTYSDEDGHMETYTDGVSSFSIFVSESKTNTAPPAARAQKALSARGAMMVLLSAFPVESKNILVTVIGEIPLQSAQKLSLSVRPHKAKVHAQPAKSNQ